MLRGYKEGMGRRAAFVSVSSVRDRGRSFRTRLALEGVPQQHSVHRLQHFPNPVVWITEVGGVVSFMASGKPRKTYGVEVAGRQIDYILSLAKNEPRVSRFFYYNWTGQSSFDSGLVAYRNSPDGDPGRRSMATRGQMYCSMFRAMRDGATSPTCP